MSIGEVKSPDEISFAYLEYRKSFGQRVRTIRKKNGLSQEELADRSKLHRNYISDVERGRRNLSLDALLKLSAGLGIQLRDLF